MTVKKFADIVENYDFNAQIIASELDTSLARMRYIDNKSLTTAYEVEQFNALIQDITNNEAVITSITDDSDLYELSDCNIVIILIRELNNKTIVFDYQDQRHIISKLNSYQNQ